MIDEPFWEASYRDHRADVWGPPSERVVAVAATVPPGCSVLDAGCGDGRNSIYLASLGFDVRAVDMSPAAIAKLRRRAEERGVRVDTTIAELADFELDRHYGLVVATGILQFVDAETGDGFIAAARERTLPGGVHVVGVFTDEVAVPADLARFTRRLFRDGELREIYADWQIERFESRRFEDEHAGGIRHLHATNDLIARRPR